ncbi:MerR family transcriptional regulator [Paenibacillus psychroresistens]|uniref:MerR family transcriptional regulator n=1 Tax=Paenibacillus psychroresistens TaxID=1778678 RepID=A0A6B8RTQ8_9BACL|nr:MerR family transcriptional regulator [Paenibacillus psychroresistens]QGQ98696.1 MerR family transcriptional regulator [Paenibacillus psychroresistens]
MYNSKMIVKQLGLSAGTLRAWETRYGVIQPVRTEGGHRLYSDEDLADLRWLKMETEDKGISIRHAAQQLIKNKALQAEALPLSSYKTPEPKAYFIDMQNNLYAHLVDFDAGKSNALVDLGFSMYQFDDMFHEVLVPLMARVGDEWERGTITAVQEHFISHFVQLRFAQFFRLFQVDSTKPKVLALCPSGEQHQVGLLLFSLFLRRKGLDVIYIGADTPLEGISQLILVKDIQFLCLSLTNPKRLKAGLSFIGSIHKEVPEVELVLGGKAFNGLPKGHSLYPYVIGQSMESWEMWYQREVIKT